MESHTVTDTHTQLHTHTLTHNTQWLSSQVVLDVDLEQQLGSDRSADISYQ